MKHVGNPIKKDRLNAMVSGVCAGVAKRFDVNVLIVRVVTVILALYFPLAIVLAYGLAVLLLSDR